MPRFIVLVVWSYMNRVSRIIGLVIGVISIFAGVFMMWTVVGVSSTILDDTFVVASNSYTWYCTHRVPDPWQRVSIYIYVASGGNRDINFWVMDKCSFENFQIGRTFRYYVEPSRTRISQASIDWIPEQLNPCGDKICFVFDNTFSTL